MKGVNYNEYYASKAATKAQSVRAQHAGVKARKATVMDSSTPYKPSGCQGVTKTGNACKARPVKSQHLCAGHLRQAAAAFKEDEVGE